MEGDGSGRVSCGSRLVHESGGWHGMPVAQATPSPGVDTVSAAQEMGAEQRRFKPRFARHVAFNPVLTERRGGFVRQPNAAGARQRRFQRSELLLVRVDDDEDLACLDLSFEGPAHFVR